MKKINFLDLKDVSFTCRPSMLNFESIHENLSRFSCKFHMGNAYAIVSEPGKGGWALSYLLAGRARNYKGNIYLDRELANSHMLLSYGWYVGEGLQDKNMFGLHRNMTIREQLASCDLSDYTMDKLIDLFELSSSRLDRPMKFISNERWNASTAIGLANGKQIFCFPLLDDTWKDAIKVRLRHCSEILKQNNCLVIIPSPSLHIIEDFVDEVVYV